MFMEASRKMQEFSASGYQKKNVRRQVEQKIIQVDKI